MERLIQGNIVIKDIDEEEFRQRLEEEGSPSDLTDLLARIDPSTPKEELVAAFLILEEAVEKTQKRVRAFGLYEGDAYVGYIALTDYESSTPEIQLELLEAYRGRGIGYQGLRLVIDEAFQDPHIDFLIYRAQLNNLASIALAQKCGGTPIRENAFMDSIIAKYHIFRPE